MNCSVYIFGNLQRGYTQYPDDYTRDIFQNFHGKATAKSQIITYRSGSLMYYGYIRNLDKTSQYIGFSFLLNGVMLPKPQELFSVFENAVERLVVNGEILGFSDSGELVPLVDSFGDAQKEVEKTVAFIRNELSEKEKSLTKLPLPDYRVAIDESKMFSAGNADDDIQGSVAGGGYTYILKEKDFDTASMASYKGVIQKLNKDKETLRLNKDKKIAKLQQEKAELSKELTKAKARQQNVTWVAVLGIVVIVFGVLLWNNVWHPSEVTHKEMGEYVYYGPLNKDRNPEGVGVAKYHDDDGDGRRYYFGNFVNGERNDTTAVLLYQQGKYFYGTIEGDTLKEGMYVDRHHNFFIGTFRNNKPYDGGLSQYKEIRKMVEGEVR